MHSESAKESRASACQGTLCLVCGSVVLKFYLVCAVDEIKKFTKKVDVHVGMTVRIKPGLTVHLDCLTMDR